MKKAYITIATALILLLSVPTRLQAQDPNRVALVIRADDSTIITRCVTFTEDEITGYQVLERSGLDFVAHYDNVGAAICAIAGTGCPENDCFCDSPPNYWSYWHWVDGAWSYANTGATGTSVGDGAIDGWNWGPGDPPPDFPFDAICAPPPTETPPTNTPAATASPAPSVRFWIDGNTVEAGTCTTIHWVAESVSTVQLNGDPVEIGGSLTTCPCQKTDYELTVNYRDGSSETRKLTLNTTGTCAAATSPLKTPTPRPTLAPAAVDAATGTATPVPLPVLTTASGSTPKPQSRRPHPTSQPSPTQWPATVSPTLQQRGAANHAQDTDEAGPLTSLAPTATATRASVEGFSESSTASKVSLDNPLTSGALLFGLILTLIGLSYMLFLRRQ